MIPDITLNLDESLTCPKPSLIPELQRTFHNIIGSAVLNIRLQFGFITRRLGSGCHGDRSIRLALHSDR